jgi:hypothetical protein
MVELTDDQEDRSEKMTKNLARREVQKFHFSARSLGELLNRKLLDRKLLDYLKANFCQISKYRKLLFKSTFDRLPLGCLSARALLFM